MYCLLVHMIDQMPVGSTAPTLNLHMTIVHWFRSDLPAEKLTAATQTVATEQSKFVAVVGEEAQFGLNHDIAVNKVVASNELFDLHKHLVQMLEKLGAEHTSPQWVGKGWNPHVTHQKSGRLQKGDNFEVDSISIISSKTLSGDRTVEAHLEF